MAHLTIEYSANVAESVDMARVVSAAHEAALATGVFAVGGMRTRAARRDLFIVADGDADNGFIDVRLLMGAGREPEVVRTAGQHIFDAIVATVAAESGDIPLAISLYVFTADPVLSWKQNNLHRLVAMRTATEERR